MSMVAEQLAWDDTPVKRRVPLNVISDDVEPDYFDDLYRDDTGHWERTDMPDDASREERRRAMRDQYLRANSAPDDEWEAWRQVKRSATDRKFSGSK